MSSHTNNHKYFISDQGSTSRWACIRRRKLRLRLRAESSVLRAVLLVQLRVGIQDDQSIPGVGEGGRG